MLPNFDFMFMYMNSVLWCWLCYDFSHYSLSVINSLLIVDDDVSKDRCCSRANFLGRSCNIAAAYRRSSALHPKPLSHKCAATEQHLLSPTCILCKYLHCYPFPPPTIIIHQANTYLDGILCSSQSNIELKQ